MSDTATALTTSPEQTPVRERPIGADPRQSPPPRANEPDLPLLDFTCRMVSQPAEMLEQLPAWRRLAEVALEPNVFLEDWFLLPAWQHLAQEQCVELLLIEAPKRVYPEGPRVLCGLMPIVRKRAFRGLPLRVWELWKHPYCFLGTPLLRRDCARQVLDHVITYARQSQPGATMVHFPMVTGDGPFHRLLVESNHDHQRTCFVKDQHTRAQFTAAEDAESFLKVCLSRKKRQGIQRMERRLAERGTLETQWYELNSDLQPWADAFLALEGSGWKGTSGTALASDHEHAQFFTQLLQNSAAAGRLQLGRLVFNGQPLAMICNLLAGNGGYSFKIAYDEAFANHSPGLLLELALIRKLHEQGIAWMDSCATAEHSLINPLWPDRALRQSWWISTGSRLGDLAVASMPLARWAKQCCKRPASAAETGKSANEDGE